MAENGGNTAESFYFSESDLVDKIAAYEAARLTRIVCKASCRFDKMILIEKIKKRLSGLTGMELAENVGELARKANDDFLRSGKDLNSKMYEVRKIKRDREEVVRKVLINKKELARLKLENENMEKVLSGLDI